MKILNYIITTQYNGRETTRMASERQRNSAQKGGYNTYTYSTATKHIVVDHVLLVECKNTFVCTNSLIQANVAYIILSINI
jgi:hypothetical protein